MNANEPPKGWEKASIAKLADEITSGFPYGRYNTEGKGFPHLRPMNINGLGKLSLNDIKYVDLTDPPLLQRGDILFNNTNSPVWVGKTTTITTSDEFTFSNHMTRIHLNRYASVPSFFALQLHYLQQSGYFSAHCTNHVNQASISLSQLTKQFELLVAPINEQQRIVAAVEQQFSCLDAGVALLRQAQKKLKRYRASVLKAAVEGELTKQWREAHPDVEPASELLERILAERRVKWEQEQIAKGRDPKKVKYVEPATPDVSRLPKLPEGWCWATVESISTKVVDGVHKKPHYVDEGIPFVTIRNLTAGSSISFEKLNYITEKDHIEFFKRANPEKGDILITKDGTLGVVRVVKVDTQFSIFVSVALVKPVIRQMGNYLETALSSPQVQVQMVPKGSGLQHIHLEDLRVDCIPLPSLAEQEQIVALVEERLSIISELETTIAKALKQAERQRQSILHQAFSGKLVPQDPNDEPACLLLERIRQQREQSAEHESKPKRSPTPRSKKAGNASPVNRTPDRPAEAIDSSDLTQESLWQSIEV